MFPPPTTIASCTPRAATRDAWRAIRLTSSTLMPPSPGRQKLSPESFSKSRRKAGGPLFAVPSIGCPSGPVGLAGQPGLAPFAHDEPGEAGHRDVLACPGIDAQAHVADGPGVVLDELLVHQADLAVLGVELSGH